MALDHKALAALAAAHPNHPGLILAEAGKDGATEASILAAISAANDSAKDAAIVAKDAAIADLTAKLAASESAKAKAEADVARITAMIPGHEDPGDLSASGADKRKIPTADAHKLTVQDLADLKAGTAILV